MKVQYDSLDRHARIIATLPNSRVADCHVYAADRCNRSDVSSVPLRMYNLLGLNEMCYIVITRIMQAFLILLTAHEIIQIATLTMLKWRCCIINFIIVDRYATGNGGK